MSWQLMAWNWQCAAMDYQAKFNEFSKKYELLIQNLREIGFEVNDDSSLRKIEPRRNELVQIAKEIRKLVEEDDPEDRRKNLLLADCTESEKSEITSILIETAKNTFRL